MASDGDEHDLAMPIYRERGASNAHEHDGIPGDTSLIPRLAEDGSTPADVTMPGLASKLSDGDIVPSTAAAQSEQDDASYQQYNSRTLQEQDDTRGSSSDDNQPAEKEASRHAKDALGQVIGRVFDIPKSDRLEAYWPAWLLKSVMVQGHIYIMQHSLCFYAFMPPCDDVSVKTGFLVKKSRTSSQYHRHWFILKNDVLSYYNDASDLYFPNGNIDLRKAKAATADVKGSVEGGYGLKLVTEDREYFFRADTASAVNEWIKVIQRSIFRIKNEGDSVKIVIPFSNVLDVEECEILDFAKTIKIRIADDMDTFALNEYYFSVTSNAAQVFDAIRSKISSNRDAVKNPSETMSGSSKHSSIVDTSRAAPAYNRPKVYESLADAKVIGESKPNIEEFAQQLVEGSNQKNFLGLPQLSKSGTPTEEMQHTSLEDLQEQAAQRNDEQKETQAKGRTKTLGSRLKNVGHIASSIIQAPTQLFNSKDDTNHDPGAEDLERAQKFRADFGLPNSERLLRSYQPFYLHGVPLAGDLYISDGHVCYRNSTPGTKIRIMLPMADVTSAAAEKAFRFGFSGLLIKIRAHEDIVLEFRSQSDRDQCVEFITGAVKNYDELEDSRNQEREARHKRTREDRSEHDQLEQARKEAGDEPNELNAPLENVIDVPAIIFDSPNASLLAFKPTKQLRFTCLTIGSRGDVQPYVALCKGLIADGQKAKIATHEEFRDFVESHGIEFVPIDGNPAELMAICVEHGMFTYTFLKEASQKFRGWIDELLKSSWKACQNTDILIESPSAMGGIHIAEALGIPYYRAFTMPWSKTRVYPHAFAVPDHSMGGNYNAFTYSAFDTLFWKGISGQVNRWRKKTLNLPSTNFDKMAQHKVPFLYNFSPSVVPPAIDWHEWIRVTGYWFLDGSDDKADKKWEAPEEVKNFIKKARDDKKKLVYIGFGSIVVSDPDALTKAVVSAVKKADARCILVKGWSARSSKKEEDSDEDGDEDDDDDEGDDSDSGDDIIAKDQDDYGDEILSLDSIPHDWLFPQIDAACHHGGAGSLGASLRAGIPTIVKPFFGDQYFFGDRIHDLGVGVCLKKMTVKSLRDALEFCTTDTLTIQKAEKIGEQIRSERGVDKAIENIYRDLEYAKSLVKYPQRAESGESSEESSWDEINKEEGVSDDDDEDLFESQLDAEGKKSSILKPFKNLKLPNPLGEHSGNYGLSGIKLFRNKAETFKLRPGRS